MTKEEFESHPEALAMTISLDSQRGEVLFDTCNSIVAEDKMEALKNEHPDMFHVKVLNRKAIALRDAFSHNWIIEKNQKK